MKNVDFEEKLSQILAQSSYRIGIGQYDKSTHRIYPFYDFETFNTSNSDADTRPLPLTCDYCGCRFSGNGSGYYSALVVWESEYEVKVCCSIRNCRKGNRIYKYHEQKYGFREPISLGRLKGIEPYEMISKVWLTGSYAFGIKQWLKGITWDQFSKFTHTSTYMGGTYNKGFFEWKNHHLIYRDSITSKPKIKLSRKDIIHCVNEILEINRPTGQLSLFDDLFKAA